jgi:hypothetical protein
LHELSPVIDDAPQRSTMCAVLRSSCDDPLSVGCRSAAVRPARQPRIAFLLTGETPRTVPFVS